MKYVGLYVIVITPTIHYKYSDDRFILPPIRSSLKNVITLGIINHFLYGAW